MVNRETVNINGYDIDYVDVKSMSKVEWESFRSSLGTVGGSDVGTICGVNLYKDALILFYEKIGLKENQFKGNKFTTAGTFFEPAILDAFTYGDDWEEVNINHRKNQRIRDSHDPFVTYFPKDMPFAHLNIDGLVTRDEEFGYLGTGVAEVKKISGRASDKYVGGIPASYIFQLQFYMWGLKAKYGYIAASVGEGDLIVKSFLLDEEIISIILEKVPRFMDAVKLGQEIMDSDLKYNQKRHEIDMLEDTFSDVLAPVNWELLGKFLAEPVNIDLRVGEIDLDDETEEWVVKAQEESRKEGAAKLAKQKYHTLLKKHMTSKEASVMSNDKYIVKFKKRLSISNNG